MPPGDATPGELDALRLENATLRAENARLRDEPRRVALDEVQLQRAALLAEAERIGHMGSWLWDPSTGEVHASDELYRMFGHSPGSPTDPGRFFSMIHPEDLPRVQEASARSVSTGESAGAIEFRARLDDGRLRHMRMDGAAVQVGEHVKFVGAILDVTEIRRADERLRRAASALNEAQRIANVGSWAWDRETGEVEWSEQLHRILGHSPATSPSFEAFAERIHPDDRARVLAAAERIRSEGAAEKAEFRVVRPDGGVRHVIADTRTWFDGEGACVRMLGVVLDVTERRALEERLRLAQKMEAVGRLAGGVAHDFNNYLQVVSANADVLERLVGGDESARSCARDIRDATRRCAGLTRQLLAFARRHPSAPRVLDADALLRETTPFLRELLGAHVALELDLSAGEARVRIDPAQLEQVLFNLALNGRDAMADGGVLRVATAIVLVEPGAEPDGARLPPGAWLRLSVRDEGSGISDEVLGRIFDPFFTTKSQGTGLGLSTVYGIVEAAGGVISVRTAEGRGTTFDVHLPIVEATSADAPVDPPSRTRERRYSLLLIEDSEPLRRALGAQLTDAGFDVTEAASGQEGCARLESGTFDLVLTDLKMPHGSGVDVARRARALDAGLPVLAMTGFADSGVGALDHEFDATLLKPFALEELLAAIDRLRDRLEARGRARGESDAKG